MLRTVYCFISIYIFVILSFVSKLGFVFLVRGVGDIQILGTYMGSFRYIDVVSVLGNNQNQEIVSGGRGGAHSN